MLISPRYYRFSCAAELTFAMNGIKFRSAGQDCEKGSVCFRKRWTDEESFTQPGTCQLRSA